MPHPRPTPDRETMLSWASLVHAGQFLTRGLDLALQARCGMSLPEQDLMRVVDRTSGGMRMGDLAERLFFSKAGMTKMVDRLEQHGWVERRSAPDDRRATVIALTPAGRRQLARARAVLVAWVAEHFGRHLTAPERRGLAGALRTLLIAHGRWEGQLAHLGVGDASPAE